MNAEPPAIRYPDLDTLSRELANRIAADRDAAICDRGTAWQTFAGVSRSFDSVVLGMGDDGHTASLFPGSPNLLRALDPGAAAGCIGMQSPTAPRARLSLNLAALLGSRHIVILITGESKWRAYSAACRPGAAEDLPVRAVLRQRRTPVDVIWSP